MEFPVPWTWEGMWQLGTIALQLSMIALVVAIVLLAAYLLIAIPLYYEPNYQKRPERLLAEQSKREEELEWRGDVRKSLQDISQNLRRG